MKDWHVRRAAVAFGIAASISGASADDVTGKDAFVCTAWHAVVCSTEGDCNQTEAWRLNLPDFLKVNLARMELATPEGSDQPRLSSIEHLARNAGRIFLSGWQQDRSYTWVINEQSGEGTLAIVSDTAVMTLFTACAASDRLQ